MKLHLLLLSTLVVLLTACTEPIIREEPVMPNQVVSLGYFPLSETTLDFSPYFLFNTLVFVDEEGTEYEWRMQQPNQNTGVTGGKPKLIETIAKAGVAVGVDGLFIETHPNPSQALSDGANMLPLDQLEELLEKLVRIRQSIL